MKTQGKERGEGEESDRGEQKKVRGEKCGRGKGNATEKAAARTSVGRLNTLRRRRRPVPANTKINNDDDDDDDFSSGFSSHLRQVWRHQILVREDE